MSPVPAFSPTLISKSTVYPTQKSTLQNLRLSVSDLPMLSCQYIQKGVLLTRPSIPSDALISILRRGLSETLSHFPPLAGRLTTDPDGHIHISCNDAGVDFVHANAGNLTLFDVLYPVHVPDSVKGFFSFAFDGTVSYDGHFRPLLAVQVTELADGVFVGCAVNHAVTDGTSFWNFFNAFAEVCRGAKWISRLPDFSRNFFGESTAVLRFPDGAPTAIFSGNGPLQERIFHFSRESILELKSRANGRKQLGDNGVNMAEILGKESHDDPRISNGKITSVLQSLLRSSLWKHQDPQDRTAEISSFQALSAQLWRSITRARKLPAAADTTFRMAVNCRHRIEPRVEPLYFGNAIQSNPTVASVGEVLSRDLKWCADLLNKNIAAHGDAKVRRGVEDWERDPKCFPLGNFDGASITMGSSTRFPMYDNDFGWGPPMAVRSGRANKFDGKISAFPGREGGGSVELEVCLKPDTMRALEADTEFMQYVTRIA
ncbi:protein ENHANCED PSEUDOMONAS SUSCEPTIBILITY 1-like [Magnolia sinica]|uniref:protein ENHANCED PSEUDOMONAS SUSCEPTIBILITY 1-like n=1 Tax=Magnolia sinica TaxID=86752 RepID=UPI002658F3AB|nr:protein ENHANCED PSEUDOMONAS SUSCEPTIBILITY 1-like [Magnolia sinica]